MHVLAYFWLLSFQFGTNKMNIMTKTETGRAEGGAGKCGTGQAQGGAAKCGKSSTECGNKSKSRITKNNVFVPSKLSPQMCQTRDSDAKPRKAEPPSYARCAIVEQDVRNAECGKAELRRKLESEQFHESECGQNARGVMKSECVQAKSNLSETECGTAKPRRENVEQAECGENILSERELKIKRAEELTKKWELLRICNSIIAENEKNWGERKNKLSSEKIETQKKLGNNYRLQRAANCKIV